MIFSRKFLSDSDRLMSEKIFRHLGPAGPLGAVYGKILWETITFTADGVFYFILLPPLFSLTLERYLLEYDLAKLVGIGLFVDLVMIVVVKQIFKRPRPVYHVSDFRFVGPDKFSFPSGHATRAWLFFGLAISDSANLLPASAGIIGGWASIVSVGRVALGRHYITDTICGALIGVLLTAPTAVFLYRKLFA